MSRHPFRTVAVLAALALLPAAALANAAPAAKPAQAAEPAGQVVAYAALEHHVGAEILIETTLNTVRRGVLVKYTNPTLTLQLGPEHGSIELSVPQETVRSVRVLKSAPQGAAHESSQP